MFFAPFSWGADNQLAKYATPMDGVDWQFNGDRFGCQLHHAIDGFGTLSLVQYPAEAITMKVESNWFQEQPVGSRSVLSAPSWLKQAPTHPHARAWQWNGMSGQMDGSAEGYLDGLEQGWGIDIALQLASQRSYQLVIEPVAVKSPLRAFRQCSAALVPQPFDVVRHVTMNYATGQILPRDAQLPMLDAIAEYVAADPRISEVLVDGHSDSTGNHLANLVLSRQRADELTGLLIERGVALSQIEIRAHGQRFPLVTERSAADREKNRRVEIRLVMSEPDSERSEEIVSD
ncbi:flagellar protein MotY [Ferrimonas pelagia]|uniref:Flagellar protein MotY n=2 Tax=Ferrimonas pelagia TaxID=1177826 RepID=A0ABP9EXK7_9GAMM